MPADEQAIARVLGAPGQVVRVRFRGRTLTVIAEPVAGQDRAPITDPVALELASGSGENPRWERPVSVHAIIDSGRDPVRTVQRVSQWASYTARAAVVPADRISDHARAEAQLRGVWLVTDEHHPTAVVPGETGPAQGCEQGLLHRLLDEHVLQSLHARAMTPATRNRVDDDSDCL